MSTGYIEGNQSAEAQDRHRAMASLMEELEAVDWYGQRAEVTTDPELKAILEHNRGEETEHAAMLLEWLRRRTPRIDEELGTYLFTKSPITEVEALKDAADAGEKAPKGANNAGGALGIGSLKPRS
jgi:ferritin-like protein